MKKFLTGVLFLALVLLTKEGAYAAGDSVSNVDTGPGSVNIAKIKRVSITKATTLQGGLVINQVSSTQNTGGNLVMGNTKITTSSLSTGDLSSRTKITNNVNNSGTLVNGCDTCNSQQTVKNNQTGFRSINVAESTEVSVTKATTVQLGVVVNGVETEQNSGGNAVIGNTVTGGTTGTGGGSSAVIIENNVNNSQTLVNTPVATTE